MNQQTINAMLLRLSKDPSFQKKVAAAYNAAQQSGQSFGRAATSGGIGFFGVDNGVEDADATMRDVVNRIAVAVQQRFPNIAYSMFDIVGPINDGHGYMQYELRFRPSYVQRDSLYQHGYPDGLENVVMLYSHGGKPNRNKVYNEHRVLRGRSSEHVRYNRVLRLPKGYQVKPDPFLRDCVAQINAELNKDGVKVVLAPAYYP